MHLQPGIFAYRLKVDRNFEITLLANLITLTPGTLSVDVSADRKTLFVHAIDCSDPDRTAARHRATASSARSWRLSDDGRALIAGLGAECALVIALRRAAAHRRRVIIGPTLPDRVVALDMLVAIAIGFIAVLGIRTGQTLYADIAIALGLVGFLATVAFARFVLQRRSIEEDSE